MKNKLTEFFKLHDDVFNLTNSGDVPQSTEVEDLQAQIDTLDKQLQKTRENILSIITNIRDNGKTSIVSLAKTIALLQKEQDLQKGKILNLLQEQVKQKNRMNWISINMVAIVIALITILTHS